MNDSPDPAPTSDASAPATDAETEASACPGRADAWRPPLDDGTFTLRAENQARRFYRAFTFFVLLFVGGGGLAAGFFLFREVLDWGWKGKAGLTAVVAAGAVAASVRGMGLRRFRRRHRIWREPFPEAGLAFLKNRVPFFRSLDTEEREWFVQGMKVFLDEIPINGGMDLDPEIRWLTAASALSVFWGLPEIEWDATGLREVIVTPEIIPDGQREEDGVVTEYEEAGFIGTEGLFGGVVTLALPEMLEDLADPCGGVNVAVHEFAHLYELGGFAAPIDPDRWQARAREEWRRIHDGRSLFDDYALADEHELFAVASEWFFTAPRALRRAHPGLHRLLVDAYRFNQLDTWPQDLDDDFILPPKKRRRRGRRRNTRRRRRA